LDLPGLAENLRGPPLERPTTVLAPASAREAGRAIRESFEIGISTFISFSMSRTSRCWSGEAKVIAIALRAVQLLAEQGI
jgi:16S rRNA U1498 N3-methylase RsmE